jgi:lon-related putative ATP-dependent protease
MPKRPAKTQAGPAPVGLDATQVYRACDPSKLGFDSTREVQALDMIVGQDRAVAAVDFGIGIRSHGYNIFALGPSGTGKASTVTAFLEREAALLPVPDDWVYVNNFPSPHQPNAIRLPAGKATSLKADMAKLVEDLQGAITQAFEGDEYEKQKRAITEEVGGKQEAKLEALRKKADDAGDLMLRTPSGLAFAPKMPDGTAMSREHYTTLLAEDQAKIDESLEELNKELQQVMRGVRQDEKAGREALRQLDREVSTYAAKHLVEDVKEKWVGVDEVGAYLDSVLADVVENATDFKRSDEEQPAMFMGIPFSPKERAQATFRKYQVNVVVDNSQGKGAPIVTESNPTFQNLVGAVEHVAQFGALVTDFMMIKAGALHRANGGFLMLEVRDLLSKPYAWDALKRTLKTNVIRIEDIGQQMGWVTTSTLDPEPIPFDTKIVLIGEPQLYYLMNSYDPDFQEMFRVKADFETVADRTAESEQLYARFLANLCQQESLPCFDSSGVARVVEHGSRLVEDQRKLTLRFLDVADLARQAAYWAVQRAGAGAVDLKVGADDVQTAIDQWVYRSNRMETRVREAITDGTIMVDTAGAVVGQINGLSVSMMGDYSFGRPSRITATTRLGDGEVINVEREVDMSGPSHSKGVLILAGYLGSKYAANGPLSFSARLVFEQSYGGVDGDSASSTELYAILSSLAGLPIRQCFAVTGSVNQRGQVQPIGGVNEKIEGYYEVCKAKGFSGGEAVLIPATNVRHLMLKREVRDAIAAGTFSIYPVETIDQGLSILTGVPAGEADGRGVYPAATVNRMVADRLAELTRKARAAAAKDRRTDGKGAPKAPKPPTGPTA